MPFSFHIYLFAALIVLVLPGYAVRVWFPSREKNLVSILAESVGLSLALTALLGLATFLFELYLSKTTLISFYLLAGLAVGTGLWYRRPSFSLHRFQVFALGAFLLLIVWRFLQIRDLALPAWVDSPNHVLIIRKIIEGQEVPRDLLPYIPVPFYYHFGFHVATVLFSFWAGLSPDQGVLIFGQILNACIFLSLYRLGLALWREEGPAILTALLAGFVSQMPAYYAAWGRYTLLTGLVLLPLAMAAAPEIKEELGGIQGLMKMGIFLSGLVLTHYFAAFLFLLFWIILWGITILEALIVKTPGAGRTAKKLSVGLGVGLVLSAPWMYRVLEYGWKYLRLRIVYPSQSLDQAFFSDYGSYLIYLLGPWRNFILIFLAALGLQQAWRNKGSRAFVVWVILLGLGVIPWGLRPMPFRPDHLAIVLFVPVSLLASWSLFQMILKWKKTGLLLMTVLLFWGLVGTWNLIRTDTILADQADLQALRWIESNAPKEARFLINITSWAWGTYRGVDGGAWITSLTGREMVVPPIFYGLGDMKYRLGINRLAARISCLDGCPPDFQNLVKENRISHIYLKSGMGSIRTDEISYCPGIQKVYDSQGILIYRVIPEQSY